ncbi:hypothetical protein DYB37_003983 [Aphanomyces astaci]|uniref:Uncharacterized protein n=2 Tax=Aphanomyces astaci TaxID=112090 RepID=A0A397AXK4_APHAT|nr:hypothetical protein DYB36_000106 [Aphanomyces astaci]RHY95355.1 hypothetical protein DYB35_007755 [Aphanomyces astaci]RHZ30391.1 hypothetical protein DYB37_003983 [Aphanomyces astaci]
MVSCALPPHFITTLAPHKAKVAMEFNYVKAFNDSLCSSHMVYLRYGPSMTGAPLQSDSACDHGLQINRREFASGQYVPGAMYMDIVHAFMWEKALDDACVGGGADFFVRPSCASRSYTVYSDANCTSPVPTIFEPSLPRISCSIPNPSANEAPNTATPPFYEVQFAHLNCSGLVQSIHPSLSPPRNTIIPSTCQQGVQTLVKNATISPNATYMTLVSSGGRTFSLLDGACVPVGPTDFAVANCLTGAVSTFADAACSKPRSSSPTTLLTAMQSFFPVYSSSCSYQLVQTLSSPPVVFAQVYFTDPECSNAHLQSVVYTARPSTGNPLPPLSDQCQNGYILSTRPPAPRSFSTDKLYMNVTLPGASATVRDATCAPLLDGYVYVNCAALSVLFFRDAACSVPQDGEAGVPLVTLYKSCFVANTDSSSYYLEIVGGFGIVVLLVAGVFAIVQKVREWRAAFSAKRATSDATDLAVSPVTTV